MYIEAISGAGKPVPVALGGLQAGSAAAGQGSAENGVAIATGTGIIAQTRTGIFHISAIFLIKKFYFLFIELIFGKITSALDWESVFPSLLLYV